MFSHIINFFAPWWPDTLNRPRHQHSCENEDLKSFPQMHVAIFSIMSGSSQTQLPVAVYQTQWRLSLPNFFQHLCKQSEKVRLDGGGRAVTLCQRLWPRRFKGRKETENVCNIKLRRYLFYEQSLHVTGRVNAVTAMLFYNKTVMWSCSFLLQSNRLAITLRHRWFVQCKKQNRVGVEGGFGCGSIV